MYLGHHQHPLKLCALSISGIEQLFDKLFNESLLVISLVIINKSCYQICYFHAFYSVLRKIVECHCSLPFFMITYKGIWIFRDIYLINVALLQYHSTFYSLVNFKKHCGLGTNVEWDNCNEYLYRYEKYHIYLIYASEFYHRSVQCMGSDFTEKPCSCS